MGCSSSTAITPSPVVSPIPETSAHLKYKLGEKIGKGSYAQVHIATRRQATNSNVGVAVKVRNLHPETSMSSHQPDKVMKSSFNEVAVWNAVGTHANCVKLLDSFFDDYLAYMVMEKCDGSLYNYLRRGAVVNEMHMAKTFKHMLAGISHMHSVNVIHRDLKPDNFLVQGSTVKICDFGLSAMLPRSGVMTGVIGTAPYMPPEMLATSTYDQKADVWSFGVVAYLLLCGAFPYQTSDGSAKMMKQSILTGTSADCDKEWLSEKAITFLQQVLTRKPEERPTAELALQLPYMTNPDIEGLPCLRSVLKSANKTGAFESCDKASTTQTDVVLGKLRRGELGEISSTSFANVTLDDVVSKALIKHTTAASDKKCESLHDSPSPSVASNKSTMCGSSRYSSENSKLSSEFSQR